MTGGALGARSINRAVQHALPELLPHCRIIHQCGRSSQDGISELDRLTHAHQQLPADLQDRYRPRVLLDELLADVYALTDLVVTRAGAGTVTELAELGLPSVLIPLVPTRNDEQRKNATYLTQAGAGVLLPQPELSPAQLTTTALQHPDRLQEMATAAGQLARPDAAVQIANLVLTPPVVADRILPWTSQFQPRSVQSLRLGLSLELNDHPASEPQVVTLLQVGSEP